MHLTQRGSRLAHSLGENRKKTGEFGWRRRSAAPGSQQNFLRFRPLWKGGSDAAARRPADQRRPLDRDCRAGVAIDGARCISIDDNFVAIDLFAPQPDRAVLQQAPSAVCSGCGALLHPHVTVVPETDFVSGRQWRCVFCDALHIADYDVRAAAEFQSQCFDVVLPAAPAAATGTTKPLHVALVDSRLLADEEDALSLL
eukprot:gene10874-7733_t